MNFYQDIRVLEDPEFSEPMLMAALFAKLHRVLGAQANGAVGVSFPRAGKMLGDTLRLHGSQDALQALQATPWLKGLRDYTQCSDIQRIPENVMHCTVSRVQVKSSAERLRRRSVKKGWLTEEPPLCRGFSFVGFQRPPETRRALQLKPFFIACS